MQNIRRSPMASSRLQLLSKKLVKPSSPTLHPLRHYKLSLIDQLTTANYIPIAFFYPNHEAHNLSPDTTQTSSILKKSLSKLLSSYYPFAGRLVGNISVDCNDMGTTFLEARIKCSMSDVLKEPLSRIENTVFPSGLPWTDPRKGDSLVVAQLTHFDCGAKALSVCFSHKVGDGNTLINFVRDWAAVARQSDQEIALASPEFIGSSLYPPADDPFIKSIFGFGEPEHISRRRVVFSGSKLNHLKAAVAAESSGSVRNPTKFEVLTALLTKCALAASRPNSDPFKPFIVGFPVNLRGLTTPPLPPSAVGNILSFNGELFLDEADMKLSAFVNKLRKRKVEIQQQYKGMKQSELVSAALEEKEKKIAADDLKFDAFKFTSLCNYPLYDLDFGWGRPMRVSFGSLPTNNSFILTDDPNGDGVEAVVSLDEQAMSIFESDPEIHAFAYFDPSIRE